MIKVERIYTLDLPDHATVDNTSIIQVGECISVKINDLHVSKSSEDSFADFGYRLEKTQTNNIVLCFDHNVKVKEFKFIKTMCPYLRIVLEVELEENNICQ